jgi:hypothetical protein
MLIIGIDPGLDGGIAMLRGDGSVAAVCAMPTMPHPSGIGTRREYDMATIRRTIDMVKLSLGGIHVCLEKQQPFPKQGGVSNYSIGHGFGLLEGLLCGMAVAYSVVHPRTWQKVMLGGIGKGESKSAAAIVATRQWPELDMRKSDKCKAAHDGIIDALLLAEYWRSVKSNLESFIRTE